MKDIPPKLYFYIPSQELINSVPGTIEEYGGWIDEFIKNKPVRRPAGELCTFGGPYDWTVQTFIYLRAYDFPCELTASFPKEGIIIAHGDLLPPFLKPSAEQFIVEIKPDRCLQCIFANFVIVQNKHDPIHAGKNRLLIKSAVVDHWPQSRLIPRDSRRGEQFENICFMGNPEEFIQETDMLEPKIKKLGLTWRMMPREKWHDYSNMDAVVAVRPADAEMLKRKPAVRLINAWSAGVPAILSPDIAFEDIKKTDLDYLKAKNVAQIIEQLKRLKRDSSLRKAMAENGKKRSEEFSLERTTRQWITIIQEHIMPEYVIWKKSAVKRMLFFPIRMLTCTINGINIAGRKPSLL